MTHVPPSQETSASDEPRSGETAPPVEAQAEATRPGRPRSERARRDITDAFREILIEEGFANLKLEHVARRAKVGKSTIYRHWDSKQALAEEVLRELAAPHINIPDVGDTRAELLATVLHPMRAITNTDFGPVIRALLSEIAVDPTLGDLFRETVVQARRHEVARVIQRGIYRGNLRADVDTEVATELLVGPVYFRLMFGGRLDDAFAERVVDEVMRGFSTGG